MRSICPFVIPALLMLPCFGSSQPRPVFTNWTLVVDGKAYPVAVISGLGTASEIAPNNVGGNLVPGAKSFPHLVIQHVYDGTTAFFDWRNLVEGNKTGDVKDVILNYTMTGKVRFRSKVYRAGR